MNRPVKSRSRLLATVAAALFLSLATPHDVLAQWRSSARFRVVELNPKVPFARRLELTKIAEENGTNSAMIGELAIMTVGGAAGAAAGVLLGHAALELFALDPNADVGALASAIMVGVVGTTLATPLGAHLANGFVDDQKGSYWLAVLASAAAGGIAATVAYNSGNTFMDYVIAVPTAQIIASVTVERLTEG